MSLLNQIERNSRINVSQQILKHAKDSSNNIEAIGDYSDIGAGKTAFSLGPPPGVIWRIRRVIVTIKDAGSFDADSYGNGIVLANGIEAWFRQGTEDIFPFVDPDELTIKTNSHWAGICYDFRVDNYGVGDNVGVARFSFDRVGGEIELIGNQGDNLAIYLNDDFSALTGHRFLFEGYVAQIRDGRG